jgi:hypothetical protein
MQSKPKENPQTSRKNLIIAKRITYDKVELHLIIELTTATETTHLIIELTTTPDTD